MGDNYTAPSVRVWGWVVVVPHASTRTGPDEVAVGRRQPASGGEAALGSKTSRFVGVWIDDDNEELHIDPRWCNLGATVHPRNASGPAARK